MSARPSIQLLIGGYFKAGPRDVTTEGGDDVTRHVTVYRRGWSSRLSLPNSGESATHRPILDAVESYFANWWKMSRA